MTLFFNSSVLYLPMFADPLFEDDLDNNEDDSISSDLGQTHQGKKQKVNHNLGTLLGNFMPYVPSNMIFSPASTKPHTLLEMNSKSTRV